MKTACRWGMPAAVLLAAVVAVLLAPAAGAATMPSQTSLGAAADAPRANVAAERQTVQSTLVDLGLTKDQAAKRVELLTDDEVHVLAADVSAIRAGGDERSFSLEQVLLIAILIVLLAD